MSTVFVKRTHDDAVIPRHMTSGAAGFDLHCVEDFDLFPGQQKMIRLGLAVEIPKGTVLMLVPRSGLAAKYGITIPNSPAIIDEDYRGEIMAILLNLGQEYFSAKAGDRVCQGVLVPYTKAHFVVVDKLGETDRGEGGFGSTGA